LYFLASDLLVRTALRVHLAGLDRVGAVTMKTLFLATALLAALPVQALAEQPGREARAPEARIQYSDLNLRSGAGVAAFDRRIARAVRLVCPDARGTVDISRKAASRRCIAAKTEELAPLRNRILAAAQGTPAILAAHTR
jgi:UrcA family protein